MKIAVVGANGKAGKLIVKEAAKCGHNVTAVVRGENETVAEQTLVKDAMELTTEDLTGFDVVVDAVGAWTPETVNAISDVAMHLCDTLTGTETCLLIVDGAGSLYVDPEHTKTVVDVTPFPEEAMPVVNMHGKLLDQGRVPPSFCHVPVTPH